MQLSVSERLHLMGLLPKEGDFLTLKTIRQTKEALAFDDDAAELGLKQEEGRISWDARKDKGRDIDLSSRAVSLIVEILSDLEKDKKLTEDHLTLYEKFMGE